MGQCRRGAKRDPAHPPSSPAAQRLAATTMEYIRLGEQGALPPIGNLAPFKAVLAIEDPVSGDRQRQVSEWLVEMGGMYVMICGANCDSWRDSIRRANLEQVPLEEIRPEQFVMITIHAHERLRSVFRHAKKYARHTDVDLHNIVTVHVSRQDREVDYHNQFNKR